MCPRPRLKRRINFSPQSDFFKPRGIPMSSLEIINLSYEEMEAIRLYELENLDQKKCAEKMNTSSSTFQRILNSAYKKIADALINGKAIEINKN